MRGEGCVLELQPQTVVIAAANDSNSTRLTIAARNISDRTVRVEGIETTCGCAAPSSDLPVLLKPDESHEFVFVVQRIKTDRTVRANFYCDVPSAPAVCRITIVAAPSSRAGGDLARQVSFFPRDAKE